MTEIYIESWWSSQYCNNQSMTECTCLTISTATVAMRITERTIRRIEAVCHDEDPFNLSGSLLITHITKGIAPLECHYYSRVSLHQYFFFSYFFTFLLIKKYPWGGRENQRHFGFRYKIIGNMQIISSRRRQDPASFSKAFSYHHSSIDIRRCESSCSKPSTCFALQKLKTVSTYKFNLIVRFQIIELV